MEKFSVFFCVYYKETPSNLDDCLQGIKNQTLQPDEIVIVKDGNLTKELDAVLLKWEKLLKIKVIGYEKNMSIGYALAFGLPHCKNNIIMRIDSDDICCPNRFKLQMDYLVSHPDIVLLGGQIKEFYKDQNEEGQIRKVPLTHNEIVKYLKTRNAFSHMSVAFKKDAVLAVGNYEIFVGWEDYLLWVKLVMAGYKTANLPDVLVNARIGNDMVGRRIGLKYVKYEYKFYKRLYNMKFINFFEFIKVICMRIPFRFLPKKVLEFVYKMIRKFL